MTLSVRSLFLMLIVSFSLTLTSCGTNTKKKAAGSEPMVGTDMDTGATDLQVNGDSDSSKAGGLRTVNFAFNSAQLSSQARSILENNAQFLKDNGSVEIQIEGHCDERGGVQYNLALGERRAKSTRDYLKSLGVAGNRMTTISFGKERPVSFGHDETSWAQNRRSNFVVTAK